MCIFEYKYFFLWEEYEKMVIYKEYSWICGLDDVFYYFVCLVDDKELLNCYVVLV